jgi:integrase
MVHNNPYGSYQGEDLMAVISVRKETSRLYIDFRFNGLRCREQTALRDTLSNRRVLNKLIDKMNAELVIGVFDYSKTFPNSRRAIQLSQSKQNRCESRRFENFAQVWMNEMKPTWRQSYAKTVRYLVESKLVEHFGKRFVYEITKSDILTYRAALSEPNTNNSKVKTLSARYINRVIGLLTTILEETSSRFGFANNSATIKPLKVRNSPVVPFSLSEVECIINNAPSHYKDYFIVRLFTGMRTGEIHGLRWSNVRFADRQICVNEAIINGVLGNTKSANSDRLIYMSDIVYSSLQRLLAKNEQSEFVFTRNDKPLTQSYITQSVWYPLLSKLNLSKRRPYNCRHTCATLWMASGENVEWISRQLGHSSTQILFDIYSNYVPNLTRQDGREANKLFNKLEVNL